MKGKTLFGVSGFAGSGKDTMADYLVENYGFKKISFAKIIKDVCRMVFGFTDEQLYGKLKEIPDQRYPFTGICVKCGTRMHENHAPDFDPTEDTLWQCFLSECGWGYEHKHITPRLAMQTLGTEWGRRLYGNIWIVATMNTIQGSDHDKWVIPDVRFRNEVHAIQDRGGLVVRLLRGKMAHDHQSEIEMAEMGHNEFDWVIDNRGSIKEFWENIEDFLERRPGN